jgi:hypothetical protein
MDIIPLKVTQTPSFLSRSFNHSKMVEVHTSEMNEKNLHQKKWDHDILHADRLSKHEQLLTRPFL